MKKRHQPKAGRPDSNAKSAGTKTQTPVKDSPEMDVYHDETDVNMYDPEVAESLKIQKKSTE